MPNRKSFTQLFVEKLKPPASGRVTYWDTNLPGFGVRVSAPRPGSRDGRKTWIAMGRIGGKGKAVMETIGTLAQVPSVAVARERARVALAKMNAGTKPLEERRAEKAAREAAARCSAEAAREAVEGQFAAVAERFLAEGHRRRKDAKPWSASYAAEVRRILEHNVLPRWGERPIGNIIKHDVNELLDAKAARRERPRKGTLGGAATQANRTLTRLRTLFAWAKGEGLIDADPTAGVLKRGAETARDRLLDDAETVQFWRAAERIGWPSGRICQLLLLTAQRESEVAGMRWSEIDIEGRVWTIPRGRTKSDRAHIVHLSAFAAEIIAALPRREGDLVFPGRGGQKPVSDFSKAKDRLDASMSAQLREETGDSEAKIPDWILHDLRRTATTIMARLNVAPHVVDKILNHTSGTIRGVAAIYNRFAYLDERAAALEALGRFVEALVRPAPANVVSLRRA